MRELKGGVISDSSKTEYTALKDELEELIEREELL